MQQINPISSINDCAKHVECIHLQSHIILLECQQKLPTQYKSIIHHSYLFIGDSLEPHTLTHMNKMSEKETTHGKNKGNM